MPRAFDENEKLSIRQQLLSIGRDHFTHYGLRKTRIEELTAAAGISKGAFYLFFDSKEALFMQVLAEAEALFRQEVLAAVAHPGTSPHQRFYRVLHTAFSLWQTIPILQIFTHADFEVVLRRVGAETMQAHLQSDQDYVHNLIYKCREQGIPIVVDAETLDGLMHTLFFASLHEDDLGPGKLSKSIDILLQLTATYAVGDSAISGERNAAQTGTTAGNQLHEQGY